MGQNEIQAEIHQIIRENSLLVELAPVQDLLQLNCSYKLFFCLYLGIFSFRCKCFNFMFSLFWKHFFHQIFPFFESQLQGVKWIKQKYGDALIVIRLGQKGSMDVLEQSLSSGSTVIFENIGETLDPVLDPLLGRNLIKKGR